MRSRVKRIPRAIELNIYLDDKLHFKHVLKRDLLILNDKAINVSETIINYHKNIMNALGFNKIQTIHYIVLPQILTYIIPVFKNESVSLVKLTSIAGYISIMDLTKASDIIRNRTDEAFFPLIFTSLLYYLICYLYIKILNILYKKINPRKEKKYE